MSRSSRSFIAFIVIASLVGTLLSLSETVSASPTFVATGPIASSTGADVTVTLPTGWEPDDIFILLGWVRDTNDVVTVTGYTGLTGTPFDRGTTSRYWVFWKRATSSEANPLFDKTTATGDTFAQIIAYRGAVLIGSPFEVTGTPATGTADPAPCTGVTTLTPGALVAALLGGEDDNNAAVVTTSTNPINYAEHYAESATGTDGMIVFSEQVRQSAGATGTVNVNFDVANPVGWGCVVVAISGVSGGGTGQDGHNSLIKLTAESPGVNCANGGTKVESGIDNGDGGGTADDGILQAGEVDATAYVCDGADGTNGTNGTNGKNALVKLSSESPGANCANGGTKIESGVDDDNDGILDPGEVDFTSYACNGANGASGFNSIVTLTPEAPGANCADGGTRIDSGLDNGDGGGTANNGILEAGEIDDTSYACDGAEGPEGPTGPPGPEGPEGPAGTAKIAWFGLLAFMASPLLIAFMPRRKDDGGP